MIVETSKSKTNYQFRITWMTSLCITELRLLYHIL